MFKLNSDRKVLSTNRAAIRPEVGGDMKIASVAFTRADRKKLDQLRAKYKISRSAIIRILLQDVT